MPEKAEEKENISEDEEVHEEEKENNEDSNEEEVELEEIIEEIIPENTALSRFLANPWKQVSLDERGMMPITNLEEDLPEIKKEEKDFEQENIEYNLFKEIEEGHYKSLEADAQFHNKNLGDEEKKFDELKRMYDDPRRLSSEFKPSSNQEPKYVKPEDTKRTDYLTKKQFGEK